MTRESVGLTCSDGILLFYLFSLAHSSLDILYHGESFGQCQRPIHVWLLISYIALVGLRIPHYLRLYFSDFNEPDVAGASLFSWKGVSKTVLMIVWFLLLPFFALWTVLGSFWLWEVLQHTPTCLPMGTDPRFIIFWQVVCYTWVVIYTVCVVIAVMLRHRQQLSERNLREVETDDTRSRWGSMSTNWGIAPIVGLQPKEISLLPSFTGPACDDIECSICLAPFHKGDSLRRLPICGHSFHQACIDLWLLRQNKCPLCKADVVHKSLPV